MGLLVTQAFPAAFTTFVFGSNILLSTLFSDTLDLCPSFMVREQFTHPYKTTNKIVVLPILILTFQTRGGRTRDSELTGVVTNIP
jgi:hypothetical protein